MNVIVAGGGKVGKHLTAFLLEGGHQVRLIENDRRKVELLPKTLLEFVIVGSAAAPDVLESAGIRQAQVVAAVAGLDETNLVVSSLARFEFGVARTIARVNDPRNAWMFTPQMGVDVALNQADLVAKMVAEEMSLGDMMTLVKLRKGQYSLVEEKVHPRARAAGRSVRELGLPGGCTLVAVIHRGELVMPNADTILQAADEVLAVVHVTQMGRLASLLGDEHGASNA
jgi:trk system potassium uptake protein TrkA